MCIPRNVLTKLLLSVSNLTPLKKKLSPTISAPWFLSSSYPIRVSTESNSDPTRPDHPWGKPRPQPTAVQLPANPRSPRRSCWPPEIGNCSRWSFGKGRRRTFRGRSLWRKLAKGIARWSRRLTRRLLMLTLISSLGLLRLVCRCYVIGFGEGFRWSGIEELWLQFVDSSHWGWF